jgi:hypothetical protein
MDGHHFDSLSRFIAAATSRRSALLALAGLALSGVESEPVDAKKKHGHKKKKKQDVCKKFGETCGSSASCCQHNCCDGKCLNASDVCCQTVSGTAACPAGSVCCDPVRSTVGGCAPSGFSVCCQSTGAAHPSTATCCSSASSGNGGVCSNPSFPNCCSATTGGGCCEAGYPVCCADSSGGYCCPAGSICCDSPTGCCPLSEQDRNSALAVAARGQKKQGSEGSNGRVIIGQ